MATMDYNLKSLAKLFKLFPVVFKIIGLFEATTILHDEVHASV